MDNLEWWRDPLELVLDLNEDNTNDSFITWCTFRAIFDLHEIGCVPASLVKIAQDVPAAYIGWENINNLGSPIHADVLNGLWTIYEQNYFETSEYFRGLFLH